MRLPGRAMLTALIASACAVACGLSTSGDGGPLEAFVGDASPGSEGGSMQADGAMAGGEGGSMPGDASAADGGLAEGGAGDGGTTDAGDGGIKDAGAEGGNPCTAGVTDPVAAASLRLVGDATYDAANKRVVLTPGATDKAGAAWISPSLYPNATGSVSFDVVIPSGGTTGEGIAFAWISTTGAAPTVGANGRSFGLCSGGMSNASGYGVIVDTDDGAHVTTLRIVNIVLGACTTLNAASTSNNGAMSHVDNGQPHTLTIAWTGTQMSAMLNGSPSLSTSAIIVHPLTSLTLGFTAATGGSTSSLQAVENISWATTCN